MSLIPIPSQPVDFTDHPELRDCPSCPAEPEPCTLIGTADTLYVQFRNEPDPVGVQFRACEPSLPPHAVIDFCGEVWIPDPLLNDPASWTLTNTYPAGTQTSQISGGQLTLTPAAAGYNQWYAAPAPVLTYPATASEQFTWQITTGANVVPDLQIYLFTNGTNTLLVDGSLIPGGVQPLTTYSGTVTVSPMPAIPAGALYFNIYDFSPVVGQESELTELYIDRVGNASGTYGGGWRHTNLDNCYAYRSAPGGTDTLTLQALQAPPMANRNWAITMDLEDVAAGGVFFQLGTQTSPTYLTSGTHTWTVYLDTPNLYSTLELIADPAFVGKVQQVVIQLLSSDIDTGGGWSVDPVTCAFRHLLDPINSTPLVLSTLLGPGLYSVSIRVDDFSEGFVYLGTVPTGPQQPAITSAGVFTYEVQLFGGTALAIYPSPDFDGLVSFEAIGLITRTHSFYVAYGAGLTQVDDNDIHYQGNYVSVRIPPAIHNAYACLQVGYVVGGRCQGGSGQRLADIDLQALSCGDPSPWTLTSTSGTNVVDPNTGCWAFPYGSGVKVVDGVGSLEQVLLSPLIQGYDYCLCVTFGPVVGNFQQVELVDNGDFSGTLSPWASGGAVGYWIYDGGLQRAVFVAPGSVATLTQTLAPLTAGQFYELSFDCILTGSTLTVSLGGLAYPGNFTASGSYTILIEAGNVNDELVFSGGFGNGSLDNVSLRTYDPNAACWNPADVNVYLGTYLLGTFSQFTGPNYIFSPGSYCLQFYYDATVAAGGGGPLRLEWNGSAGACFAIDYVSLERLPATIDDMDGLSNCIEHTSNCDTSYVVAGVAPSLDQANVPNYYLQDVGDLVYPVAYGFQFSDYFQLAQRVRLYFTNPTHDGRISDYAYRNGYNLRTGGDLERVWDLVVGGLGVRQHEALAVMSKCQYLLVDGKPYLVTQDDYVPAWDKTSNPRRADVSLEVREVKNARKFLRRIY